MHKPIPKPVDPKEVRQLAEAVIRAGRFPTLASMDGDQPRVRPVSPVRVERFTIYVANLRGYHKTAEIATNPRVELCYMDDEHNQVRVTGLAEPVADRGLIEEIFAETPLLRYYLHSPDNPDLIIYRITPSRVRYMREWALEYHEVPLDDA